MFFSNKLAFLFIAFIPFYIYSNLKNKKYSIIFNKTELFENKKTIKVILYKLLLPLRIVIFILLILAMARPQTSNEKIEKIISGIDLVLAIDLSKSMLAQDLKTDRITVAKSVISNFIEIQKENRIGLVVFSGRSFTLSPLTTDYNALKLMIDNLSTESIAIDGTAIGMAIVNSIYLFDDKKRTKVIILLTDGENNVNDISIEKAVQIAKYKKVKIYTIGLGKKEGVPIPIKTFGDNIIYARDINGNIIYSKVNEKELRYIAKETNANYFDAHDKNTLQNIYSNINSLEKSDLKIVSKKEFEEKFHYFLVPAFILLIAEFIITVVYLNYF